MKTIPNNKSVEAFLESIENEKRKSDSYVLLEILSEISRQKPVMWGESIIGFGSYHYRYDSGREGDMFLTGFSPRKQNLVIYVMNGCKTYEKELLKLGKHKTGSSCLYLNQLGKIDLNVLKTIIENSVAVMRKKYN